jgi:hypothetical protein
MPWQRLVADVGLELLDDGTPAYREIVCTVPRQNGKTTLTLAFEIQRAVGRGVPQSIAYTAQDGKAAREKLLIDQAPLLLARGAPVRHVVDRVMRGIGNESITFTNGSRIFTLASSEQSGHGKVIDLGVIDESFADEDDRREQAMLPAMLTRPEAQILNISTAGTDRSAFLKRKVDTGRAAVAAGKTTGIAYFEYSAAEGADISDPETWYSCMPALGYTIDEAVVRHAFETMTDGEFRRAMCNQWTTSDDRVIPKSVWDAVCMPTVEPVGRLVFAVDVDPNRAFTSIAVADDEGRVELLHHDEGVGWAVPRLVELSKKYDADVVLDSYGPASNLVEELEAAEVTVHAYDTRAMSRACADFFDAVADAKVQIRTHDALEAAARAANKRQTGDTWLWGRKNAGDDVSPLIAATIAFDKAAEPGGDVFFAFG